jgi:hypothetical protein
VAKQTSGARGVHIQIRIFEEAKSRMWLFAFKLLQSIFEFVFFLFCFSCESDPGID